MYLCMFILGIIVFQHLDYIHLLVGITHFYSLFFFFFFVKNFFLTKPRQNFNMEIQNDLLLQLLCTTFEGLNINDRIQ